MEDIQIKEFFELWNEENGSNTPIPHGLARELIDIYKNSKTYFKVENKDNMTHQEYIRELKRLVEENKEKEKYESNLRMIMRQTNYDRDTAVEALKRNETVEKCIEEYLGVEKNKNTTKQTTNQAIYSSIRNWMNNN
jgi:hypothetical protein